MQRAAYRVGQFLTALRANVHPPDDAPALAVLPPNLRDLFERMPPEDRCHGLKALEELQAQGETDPILLQAALIHDVGKADAGVTVVHRVARVLLRPVAPGVWRWLSGRPTGWRRPFWVVANHPERGAVWIESAGGPPELVALVRYHEDDAPGAWAGTDQGRRHAALSAVDEWT